MSNTSWQVKARYNAKTYGTVTAKLPKAIVTEFKKQCTDRGISQSQIIRKAIEDFITKEPS